MLSVDQAELTPDLAKSALHLEYEFVELTCFVCTTVTTCLPGLRIYVFLLQSNGWSASTAESYQNNSISVNRSIDYKYIIFGTGSRKGGKPSSAKTQRSQSYNWH
jgi:hypothetical protein